MEFSFGACVSSLFIIEYRYPSTIPVIASLMALWSFLYICLTRWFSMQIEIVYDKGETESVRILHGYKYR